ncbi:hypothetical protein Tco_1206393, partial [Tanacetum coccineum]
MRRRSILETIMVTVALDEPCTTALIGTNVPTNSGNVDGNSSGGSPGVVKDGMDSGFVDLKVVEGLYESVSTVLKSFASLVTNEAGTCK